MHGGVRVVQHMVHRADQQATKGNNWNWKECYKLDKIAKLIKHAF